MENAVTIESAEAKFNKKRKISSFSSVVFMFLFFTMVLSSQFKLSVFEPSTIGYLLVFSGIASFAILVWSARCTLCGGSIKYNGKECTKCGHQFGASKGA